MKIEVLADADTVARQAAAIIAAEARDGGGRAGPVRHCRQRRAVRRGSCCVPWPTKTCPGEAAPCGPGGRARGSCGRPGPEPHPPAREPAGARARLRPEQIHAMPVEAPDLEAAADALCPHTLERLPARRRCSTSSTWASGPTATPPPWCPVIRFLTSPTRTSALTDVYQGRRRMTLTYPIINRSRRILWLVTGNEKAGPLARLRSADRSIPAGRVCQEQSRGACRPSGGSRDWKQLEMEGAGCARLWDIVKRADKYGSPKVKSMTNEQLDQLSINTIRTLSIDAVQQANSGHPGTPMALAPLVYTIWNRVMRFDPEDPIWPNRDRFVLSNGHASMLLWSVLHLTGTRR